MGQKFSLMVSCLHGYNINSFSTIFDADGNERDGLKLKQAEWNILQMGTTKYEANCKRIRLKNIYIETADLPVQKSVPIMTDQIISPEMDILVDYTNPLLEQYRSFTHDAIFIYGFIPENAQTGTIKGSFIIAEGLSEWSEWSTCSTICGKGSETRSRTCAFDGTKNEEALTDERSCHPEDCCIDYRKNVHCGGDILYDSVNELKTTSVMPTLQAEQGYGRCASLCLGIPGSVSFNWKVQGSTGHCQYKISAEVHLKPYESAGDNCSDPGYNQNTYEYGNGIFKFNEQSIGGSDVSVCQLVDPVSGETANYLAVQGSDNVSKDWAGGGHGRIQGTTHYDALRIIESTDGIYIKLSDGTFSRSSFINNGDTHQLYYTEAHDCSGVFRTSTADLGRTNFRFLSSVAETYKPGGWRAYGEGSLSSNNQRLTVRSSGLCGSTKTNLPNYMVPIEFINF